MDCRLPDGNPCPLCCIYFYVKELDKEAGKACEHLENNSCRIHGSHPEECQKFCCSQVSSNIWREQYHRALERGLITKAVFDELIRKINSMMP